MYILSNVSTGYGSDNSKGLPKGWNAGEKQSTNSSSGRKYKSTGSRYGTYAESGYSSAGSQVCKYGHGLALIRFF